MNSPTQAVLKHLRKNGWQCAIVERYIAAVRQRFDAFGFGDILAYRVPHTTFRLEHDNSGRTLHIPQQLVASIALVQATSDSNRAGHRTKIMESKHFAPWIKAGGRVFLATAGSRKEKGKRRKWTVTVEELR
jgi:hypothetical protein